MVNKNLPELCGSLVLNVQLSGPVEYLFIPCPHAMGDCLISTCVPCSTWNCVLLNNSNNKTTVKLLKLTNIYKQYKPWVYRIKEQVVILVYKSEKKLGAIHPII